MSHSQCNHLTPFCSVRMCGLSKDSCYPGTCTECSMCTCARACVCVHHVSRCQWLCVLVQMLVSLWCVVELDGINSVTCSHQYLPTGTACSSGIDGTCGPACLGPQYQDMKCKVEKTIKDCSGNYCPQKYLRDGKCDQGQDRTRQKCNFNCDEFIKDGGDCLEKSDANKGSSHGTMTMEKQIEFYPFGTEVCTTPLGNCTFDLLNNNKCDPVCQFEKCNWDYFDCCRQTFVSDDINTTLLSFELSSYNMSSDSNPFPKPGDDVPRFVTHSKNVLLGGIMMRQKRPKMDSCEDETFPQLTCAARTKHVRVDTHRVIYIYIYVLFFCEGIRLPNHFFGTLFYLQPFDSSATRSRTPEYIMSTYSA